MKKEIAALPLRDTEEVIEEFGVSRKYSYLLIVVGGLILGAGIWVYMSANSIDGMFRGAAALAPLLGNLIWIALTLAGVYVIGMGVHLQVAYKFFLTNQRVIENVGFLAQRTMTTDYQQINDIVVRQDFINRIFLDTGTIGISTPGTAGEEYKLLNVDHPVARRELIRGLIRAVTEGHTIDKYYVAHLKAANGMATNEEEALAELNESLGVPANSIDDTDEARLIPEDSKDLTAHVTEFHSGQTPSSATFGDTSEVNLGTNTSEVKENVVSSSAPSVPSLSDQSVPSDNPTTLPSSDDAIEDLLGDGIDESDRIRHAQKRITAHTADTQIPTDIADKESSRCIGTR